MSDEKKNNDSGNVAFQRPIIFYFSYHFYFKVGSQI